MLIGRERECARLDELLEEARHGHSRALVLRGDPGIGKTALLQYAIESAHGFRVLRAVGIESESKLAFSGLHQLLLPVLGALDQVPEVAAEALSRSLALTEPGEVNPFLAYAGALQLLAAASDREPILAVLDDAHWLDPASAEAITFAARRLEAEPVALLFAVREGEATRLDTRAIPDLPVEGLGAVAASRLLAGANGGSIASRVAGRLIAATAGNPLALVEVPPMLSEAQRAGTEPLDDPLAVGESVERAFLSRARSLSSGARDALLIAAASDTGDLAAIARACGGMATALDEAEAVGLIEVRGGELAFRHPLMRSAVYSAVPAGARREAHAALAEAFGAEDADRRAWHLAAASLGADETTAFALEQAAGRARARGGMAAEARLLERAAELTPEPALRAPRLLRAGTAAQLAGASEEAQVLLEDGLRLVEDPLVEADLYDASFYVAWSRGSRVDHDTCLAVSESVQALDPVRAANLLHAPWYDLSAQLELEPARLLAERARSLAQGQSNAELGPTLSTLCWQALHEGRIAEGTDLALQAAEVAFTGDSIMAGVLAMDFAECLTYLEQYRVARQLVERGIADYRSRGALLDLVLALATLAVLELRLGRLLRARAAASEAVHLTEEPHLDSPAVWALLRLAAAEALLGQETDCRRHADEAIEYARETGHREVEVQALDTLGRLHLGLGRSEESILCFERVRQTAGSLGGGTGYLPWRPDLIEAYVRADRSPEAVVELEAFEDLAEIGSSAWASAAIARCRALLADEDALDDAFAVALERCTDSVSPFERARTELLYGERLRRTGRRLDSREHLRAALDEFERLGASSWAERAREELRASGETTRRRDPALVDQLTPRELEIALQVADGGTNKEVAARLFLSPKTVELHLGRVYRKLGIRSRTELARLMPR